ncbi:MAG: hypothetical protein REI96_10995 [Flavobacterium nitrogenifigens]|uniref:hypothetical protein n=1 Tax=Flavobacterium nitrogenifigens TaxID=1617283 RepID=UPI0028084406|nr:hypothetical protein [Flavobacterium nitrogenifigens]MDQ8012967.1 hypothetical protein [Flavobacterium nitrogenifigens]
MDYFDEQNSKFYDFLNETFKINKERNWDNIAKQITKEKIVRTYRYFSKLYPINFNYTDELIKCNTDFTNIHYSTLKGSKIIDEVVRFSLYSDKILVFHPLQNPSVTSHAYNPTKNPKLWLPDFLESLYFYTVLQKWVRAGIVKLIINPCEYNLKLRDEIDSLTEKRFSEAVKEGLAKDKIFQDEIQQDLAAQFANIFHNKNRAQIIENLLVIEQPSFSIQEAEDFADKIIEIMPKSNPLYKKLSADLKGRSMVNPTKGGGSLDSLLYIADKTGGNLYTPSETNWNIIKNFGVNDFWVKTNKLYSDIPLTFLNNVDTNFALELKKENRLAGVRQELKKIYKELDSTTVDNFNPQKLKFIQEGFMEEINKAESEWKLIRKQAETSRMQWVGANLAVPIVTNHISLLPLVIGSAAWFYKNEIDVKEKLKNYRQKTPVSVFVDLKNQRQSYFTELKNCIF